MRFEGGLANRNTLFGLLLENIDEITEGINKLVSGHHQLFSLLARMMREI